MSKQRLRGTVSFSDGEEEEDNPRSNDKEDNKKARLRDEDFLSRTEYELASLSDETLVEIRRKKAEALRKYPVQLQCLKGLSIPNRLPTGLASLDRLLCGGLSQGQGEIIEIRSASGIGKTQLCMTLACSFASSGRKRVILIDTCNGIDPHRLRDVLNGGNVESTSRSGVDMENLFVVKAMSIEAFLDVLDVLSNQPSDQSYFLIVIDSFAHLVSTLPGSPAGNILAESLVNVLRQLVVTNHSNVLVTNFGHFQDDGSFRSALGSWWSYTPHHVLFLENSHVNSGIVECRLQATSSLATPVGTSISLTIGQAGVQCV